MKGGKAGFVAVVGRPNVGKSTFVNRVVGEKVSIVSRRPQTTRDRISGIFHDERGQIILIDSPGIHDPGRALNRRMVVEAFSSIRECDLVIHMTDKNLFKFSGEEKLVLEELRKSGMRALLVINKIDTMTLRDREAILQEVFAKCDYEKVFDTDSRRGIGHDQVVEQIFSMLPYGPPYFPDEYVTDKPVRFLCKEMIREKLFTHLLEELPYSIAVTVDQFKEIEEKNLVLVSALIYVERESQKGIVIGRGGTQLKKIGEEARRDMEECLGRKVHLDLFVKVEKGWTRKEWLLRKMEY